LRRGSNSLNLDTKQLPYELLSYNVTDLIRNLGSRRHPPDLQTMHDQSFIFKPMRNEISQLPIIGEESMSAINQSINQSHGSAASVNSRNQELVLNESSDGYLTPNPVQSSNSSRHMTGSLFMNSSKDHQRPSSQEKTIRAESTPLKFNSSKPNKTLNQTRQEEKEGLKNPRVLKDSDNQSSNSHLNKNQQRDSYRFRPKADHQKSYRR